MPTRRKILTQAGAAMVGTAMAFRNAHGMNPAGSGYLIDNDLNEPIPYPNVHEGKGEIAVKFFRFEGGAEPALQLTYDIPPGASEGVHTHNLGDEEMGSFDEFYYIVSGTGQMEIDGEIVPVKPGDNVFTPNGVAHGIENTASEGNLKVFLIALRR